MELACLVEVSGRCGSILVPEGRDSDCRARIALWPKSESNVTMLMVLQNAEAYQGKQSAPMLFAPVIHEEPFG